MYPSWTACCVSENAPLIRACDATTAAADEMPISGYSSARGARRKKGFSAADGSRSSSAPWPK